MLFCCCGVALLLCYCVVMDLCCRGVVLLWSRVVLELFSDDEDKTNQFYVTDVKYHAPFKTVCCFSVPYHGDVAAANLLAVNLHNSSNADDYIYDCKFVRNNIVSYELSLI